MYIFELFLSQAPQWQTFNGGNWAILEEVNLNTNFKMTFIKTLCSNVN